MNLQAFFLMGFVGGVIRAVVGLIKYSQRYKDVAFRPKYLLGTVLLSGVIGFISAWIIKDLGVVILGSEEVPLSVGLIAGYAGGDLIDNLFKIVLRDKEFSLEKVVNFFKKND